VEDSLVTANRSTHFKIALVAVLATAAVIWIASCARVNAISGSDKRGLATKSPTPAVVACWAQPTHFG
jgi:hypothetical protein